VLGPFAQCSPKLKLLTNAEIFGSCSTRRWFERKSINIAYSLNLDLVPHEMVYVEHGFRCVCRL
jgi:hypothetical protein